MSKYRNTYINAHWSWYLTHPWDFFSELYKEIRTFIQRGWRGYADSDVWGLSSYLDSILAGGLKQLSKGCSYPGRDEMDTYENWQYALESNAKRFENVEHYEMYGWGDDEDGKKRKNVYREHREALKFVTKWWLDLWD